MGPTERWWCASTLGAALLCSSSAGSDLGLICMHACPDVIIEPLLYISVAHVAFQLTGLHTTVHDIQNIAGPYHINMHVPSGIQSTGAESCPFMKQGLYPQATKAGFHNTDILHHFWKFKWICGKMMSLKYPIEWLKRNIIQWGFELQTSLAFKWWKEKWLMNGLLTKLHLKS